MTTQPKAYSYIRFSTPEQQKGDSLRRQINASDKYCQDKGLSLDTTLNMKDMGLSAFHGVHRTKGALGGFLQLVEMGKIPVGSVLIVENLDRLSREQVLDALNQFTSIIRSGIRVVTLQDGMEYTEESVNANFGQLLMSIVLMSRAHEESKTKSLRATAVWDHKRQEATRGQGIITGKTVEWIQTTPDNKFIRIPQRCKAIELIFRKKLEGKGAARIEQEMNDDPTTWKPPITKRNKTGGWHRSYILKILTNRQVIGEYQPHVKLNGERTPNGKVIKNYFPPAFDDLSLFYQVQELIERNGNQLGQGGGKVGKAYNLFAHLLRCGLCGGPIHLLNKGKTRGLYLYCDSAMRLKTCTPRRLMRYDEFERLIFDNLEELDISSIIPGEDELQIKTNELQGQQSINTARLSDIEKEILNIKSAIRKTSDDRVQSILNKDLINILDEQTTIIQTNEDIEKELKQISEQRVIIKESIKQTGEIYKLQDSITDEEGQINLRLKLRVEIQKLIEWIQVYPLQETFIEQEEIEPYIYKTMYSKSFDHIRIKFRGGRHFRVLYLKRFVEID